MKKYLFTMVVFVAVILSACGLDSATDQPNIPENSWRLVTINQADLLAGTRITLIFEGNQISGSAGCNHYSASYEVSGDSIAFSPIVQTEMACMEPAGVMEQERSYLGILGAAHSFDLEDGLMTIVSKNGQTLNFQPLPSGASGLDLSSDSQTSVSQTNPGEEAEPALPAMSIELPAGFKEYQDAQAGISIYIPEEWYIQNQSIVAGEYAIFSSYPPDKYIGGGARQPGDTKCDLNLNPSVNSVDALVQQWESSSITTIVSGEEFVLDSGISGVKFVIDSMGRSTTLVAEVDNRLVIFTCWGEFELFDQIAVTLHAPNQTNP
ncbi:MAG: META domain-containing protein [Anaerolineales bacterium]|jgi:heat shock protein HslJ